MSNKIKDGNQIYENDQKRGINSFFHSKRYKEVDQIFKNRYSKGQKLKILDIGCGTAKTFEVLNQHFELDYTGVDLIPYFIEQANLKYGQEKNFTARLEDITKNIQNYSDVDVIIALETFEHIPEDLLTPLIMEIGKMDIDLFVVSVPVEVGLPILVKNIGSWATGYKRHKEYTWRETFLSFLGKTWKFDKHTAGHKGFNWKVLIHQLHQFIGKPKLIKMPFSFFATNVMFVCTAENKEKKSNQRFF